MQNVTTGLFSDYAAPLATDSIQATITRVEWAEGQPAEVQPYNISKTAVGVYTGRPGPADLCIYDIVDGTGRPVQVSTGLLGLFSFAPRGNFPDRRFCTGRRGPLHL